MKFDIFCQVIDNFGDIGVCWRLSRQLTADHAMQVRLWVDDLASLKPLCPEADVTMETQLLQGIEVRHWTGGLESIAPADAVIEAFGCKLPEAYLAAMARQPGPPVWINLEYLTAESWIDGCHGMPSPHPRLPLTKYFFFPGFSAASGGLLREKGLIAQRNRQQNNVPDPWKKLGLEPPEADHTTVSLFCYDNAPIAELLTAWSQADAPLRCLLPAGKTLPRVARWFGQSAIGVGDRLHRGNLTLEVLPFLRQEDYDILLWACDCNFVRGEDSFVRAQWAGRPMVWQAYVQQEDAHQLKLAAFLDRYCASLEPAAAAALRQLHLDWNNAASPSWDNYWREREAIRRHASRWAEELAGITDLASNLVIFCKNRV